MKWLLIGQEGVGKTTLTRWLAQHLDHACYRIDDCRRYYGDGSIAGDYRARAAFLEACSDSGDAVLEFSGLGHHRTAVRRALLDSLVDTQVVHVICEESVRRKRIEKRSLEDVPFPEWGTVTEEQKQNQAQAYLDDLTVFWAGQEAWNVWTVRGDQPPEAAMHQVLGSLELQVRPTYTASKVASRVWIAQQLDVAPAALQPWNNRPPGLQDQPHHDRSWSLVSPEVQSHSVLKLTGALTVANWHIFLSPLGQSCTLLSALSPDWNRCVEVKLCWSQPITATAWAARFLSSLERASAWRASADAVAWQTNALEALRALERCWWQASGYTAVAPGEPAPPVRREFPTHLWKPYRYVAPTMDLATVTSQLDHLYRFAMSICDDLKSHHGDSEAVFMLAKCLPVLREKVLEERDGLWNYRDVATFMGTHLRPGVLFRGSSPDRYGNCAQENSRQLIERWISERRINECVDLRSAAENTHRPYPERWAGVIERHSHPMRAINSPDLNDSKTDWVRIYLSFFEDHLENICGIIHRVIEARNPVLIHCHAGVDRTGVVIFTIGYLCDVPEKLLINDYLASGGVSAPYKIKALLNHLNKIGDAQAVAKHIGLAPQALNKLLKKIKQ